VRADVRPCGHMRIVPCPAPTPAARTALRHPPPALLEGAFLGGAATAASVEPGWRRGQGRTWLCVLAEVGEVLALRSRA
jgi:hypothetical protein